MTSNQANGTPQELRYVDLPYKHNDWENTARELVYQLQPEWRDHVEEVKIVHFKDGITNTLLKLARHTPGASQEDIDRESVLLRAYGNNTEILIDRDREATSHLTCSKYGLAPPLLARFQNGLLYRFIPGDVCTAQDLTNESIWRPVARRLGEWHATIPTTAVSSYATTDGQSNGAHTKSNLELRQPSPNIWAVMRKWVQALPQGDDKERARKVFLEKELERSFDDLDSKDGPGEDGFVFGHLDLLSANVIMTSPPGTDGQRAVSFIDYEYAQPCPAAFDIANHFAEWGGYDCDYTMLPTSPVRRAFLQEYLSAYNANSDKTMPESMLSFLEKEVDRYRGMPGMYWGIWALIQAQISTIDFPYQSYSEERLGEYTAWRNEASGERAKENEEMPLRERRWAEQ